MLLNKSNLFYTIFGIVFVFIMLFPLYWAIVASLKTNDQLFQNPPSFLPPTPTLDAYKMAINTQGQHIITSLIISIGTVFFTLIIATPAAYALTYFRFRITAFVVLTLLLIQMVPSVIIANSLFILFNKLGLLNTYIGLIFADSSISIPFAVLIIRAFMQSIPRELSEAAFVDGAGDWKTFTKIIVPVSKSALVTAGLFSFLYSWGDFLFALTVTTEKAMQPITLGLYTFLGQYQESWNEVMASAVLASIPTAILIIVTQKYITAGLTNGSLKG